MVFQIILSTQRKETNFSCPTKIYVKKIFCVFRLYSLPWWISSFLTTKTLFSPNKFAILISLRTFFQSSPSSALSWCRGNRSWFETQPPFSFLFRKPDTFGLVDAGSDLLLYGSRVFVADSPNSRDAQKQGSRLSIGVPHPLRYFYPSLRSLCLETKVFSTVVSIRRLSILATLPEWL